MNVYQDIQSHKMRYLINYVYWTCLFKSIKNNRNANETDWINSHPKKILRKAEHIRNII
jgi:hypothetical protein